MKLKKVLALAMVSVMALSMTACGGKEKEKETEEKTSSKDAKLTVAIWDSNQEPGLKKSWMTSQRKRELRWISR